MSSRVSYLLVGDPEDSCFWATLQRVLETRGDIEIVTAKRAIEMIVANAFQAVFVDATAVEHFVDLVANIRRVKSNTNVIVMTASPNWELAREAFMSGATDYIVKSLDEGQFGPEIHRALDRTVLPWPRINKREE